MKISPPIQSLAIAAKNSFTKCEIALKHTSPSPQEWKLAYGAATQGAALLQEIWQSGSPEESNLVLDAITASDALLGAIGQQDWSNSRGALYPIVADDGFQTLVLGVDGAYIATRS